VENKQISDRPLFRKWWFWAIIAIAIILIGVVFSKDAPTGTNDDSSPQIDTLTDGANSAIQNVGTLPVLSETDYKGKEGLVVFKDLVERAYTVTVEFVNEAAPAASRDLTETFTNADVNNLEDRQAFDAWVVKTVKQDGDAVHLTIG
jgi:hypothetical protein